MKRFNGFKFDIVPMMFSNIPLNICLYCSYLIYYNLGFDSTRIIDIDEIYKRIKMCAIVHLLG